MERVGLWFDDEGFSLTTWTISVLRRGCSADVITCRNLIAAGGLTVVSVVADIVCQRVAYGDCLFGPLSRPRLGCPDFDGAGLLTSRCRCWLMPSLELDGCEHTQ